MKRFDTFLEEQMKDPDFKNEFENLQPELDVIRAIVDARTSQNLTQKQLSERTGINQADISKLERNHVKSVESRVVNLSEISDKITVESMKEAMIKATNAVRLGKAPTESKVEEYKKIFENDEWILEGKIN